jgi:hypothetical protein
MNDYEKDYIVILICDNIPNQKFWNANIADWTSKFEDATMYPTYAEATRTIWKEIPESKVIARITSSNKELYYLMLSGKWDGIGSITKPESQ